MKPTHSFSIQNAQFLLNSKPFHIICGELHFPRIPIQYWRHRLLMAKAMGLNTVCLYLFWNYHEHHEGRFNFSGQRSPVAFTKLCQELGLWVILRPGPYSCAEWDFGGFPWWLLKDRNLKLRCTYPGFLNPAKRYLQRVAKELAPLQVTRGGPILMVQVENEYGAFGNDKPYCTAVAKTLQDSGFDVPLVRCDWATPSGLIPGEFDKRITTVANFGSKAKTNITALAKAYPKSPRMCGEFWMGWFDWWGSPRNGKDFADGIAHSKELQWMLDNKVSFSLYMFHGGTNFGFSAGANNHDRFDPYVTSYDYFAPLNENGRPREKFFLFRNQIAQATGITPPEPPPPIPTIRIPRFKLTQCAPLLANLKNPKRTLTPEPMEMFNQSHGCILYRTDLTHRAAGEADLRITEVHDFAWIFLNGKLLGTLNRHLKQDRLKVKLPTNGSPAILDILVESMGRVNFGPRMVDENKGITKRVEHGFLTLFDWQTFNFPLDAPHLKRLRFSPIHPKRDRQGAPINQPAFFRATFNIPTPGDTFLDLRGWGKGYVWINRRLLGRYWHIGPQQTLYLPGVWLKKGQNEIIVLDLINKGTRTIQGLDEAVLEEMNLTPDFIAAQKK